MISRCQGDLPIRPRQQKSCTSGKAGGLICEPLKAVWPATPARFLFEHLQLIESTIFFLLLSDVISHLRLVPLFDFTLGPHPISSKGTTELGGAKRRSAF